MCRLSSNEAVCSLGLPELVQAEKCLGLSVFRVLGAEL